MGIEVKGEYSAPDVLQPLSALHDIELMFRVRRRREKETEENRRTGDV